MPQPATRRRRRQSHRGRTRGRERPLQEGIEEFHQDAIDPRERARQVEEARAEGKASSGRTVAPADKHLVASHRASQQSMHRLRQSRACRRPQPRLRQRCPKEQQCLSRTQSQTTSSWRLWSRMCMHPIPRLRNYEHSWIPTCRTAPSKRVACCTDSSRKSRRPRKLWTGSEPKGCISQRPGRTTSPDFWTCGRSNSTSTKKPWQSTTAQKLHGKQNSLRRPPP